jgi:hypothetical protein
MPWHVAQWLIIRWYESTARRASPRTAGSSGDRDGYRDGLLNVAQTVRGYEKASGFAAAIYPTAGLLAAAKALEGVYADLLAVAGQSPF